MTYRRSFAARSCDCPTALSELELLDDARALAARNRTAPDYACFLGAGAYRHFIPSIVAPLVMRGEFLTSYTPYQPEVSQGTLQTIFEFQSLVCELTGMDVANAGMYDGASALAEACLMACAVTGRKRIAISDRVHPNWLSVVRGYAHGRDITVDVQPHGAFALSGEHACLAVAQPDFLGRVSVDAATWGDAAHAAGALYVVAAEPISLGLYRPPSEYGADIVVAEGQSLGVPLSFGGPYVGMFACREKYVRQMPGRIVGQTKDIEGRTGYVLTLADARAAHPTRARDEQHLHERAADRTRDGGVRGGARPARPAPRRGAVLREGALRARTASARCQGTPSSAASRSSTSSWCGRRSRRPRSTAR